MLRERKAIKMSDKNENFIVFEDVESSSKPKKNKKFFGEEYAQKTLSNLDKVLKTVSFIVAIGVFVVFVAIAAVLLFIDSIFTIVSVGLLVLGAVISLIFLFLIYAIGQIISQNNEILKKL